MFQVIVLGGMALGAGSVLIGCESNETADDAEEPLDAGQDVFGSDVAAPVDAGQDAYDGTFPLEGPDAPSVPVDAGQDAYDGTFPLEGPVVAVDAAEDAHDASPDQGS